MRFVIEFQCYKVQDNPVIKEISICGVDSNFLKNIIFKPPCSWYQLNQKDIRTNRYLYHNIHNLHWNQGTLPISYLKEFLFTYIETDDIVYTKGLEKQLILEELLQTPNVVVNLEDLHCPKAKDIKDMFPHHNCSFHHKDFECAVKNSKIFASWMKINCFRYEEY